MSVVTPETMADLCEAMRNDAVSLVKCDRCDTVIDALGPDWHEMHLAGEIYNDEIVCWKCNEKEGEG